jgi:hypothetical protein
MKIVNQGLRSPLDAHRVASVRKQTIHELRQPLRLASTHTRIPDRGSHLQGLLVASPNLVSARSGYLVKGQKSAPSSARLATPGVWCRLDNHRIPEIPKTIGISTPTAPIYGAVTHGAYSLPDWLTHGPA